MPRIACCLLGLVLAAPGASPAPPSASGDPSARRARAFAALAAGDHGAAAEAFARVVEADPGDGIAAAGRVRALLAAQRWREALSEARAHAAGPAAGPPVLAALGQALYRAGRLDEVDRLLAHLVERTDGSGRGLACLGRLREAQGRTAEAVALMSRAVEAAPDDRDVLYWAAGATPSRAVSVRLLERYLAQAAGDDPERVESAEGWVELMRTLGERPIWIDEQRPDRVEIPLRRIWDSATGTTQGLVIDVRLGGGRRPVPLLLDSGSPGLFVIKRAAKKRGFSPLAAARAYGGGGDRRHRTMRGLFSEVAIGELRFRDALATSSKQELDPTGRYHGVIGLSVFNGYRVELDLRAGRLLLQRSEEPVEGDPYWSVAGQMLVRASLADVESGLFLLDTGATHTQIDRTLAERLPGARIGVPVVIHGFGGTVEGARRLDGVRLTFQTLESGREPLRAVDLSTRSRLSGVEVSGFVGLDLLDGARIVVDTVDRRVRVDRRAVH